MITDARGSVNGLKPGRSVVTHRASRTAASRSGRRRARRWGKVLVKRVPGRRAGPGCAFPPGFGGHPVQRRSLQVVQRLDESRHFIPRHPLNRAVSSISPRQVPK